VLTLYHWEPTLDSGEPLVCLKEKALEFESRYVDLLALEQHLPEFLALNPSGQVPVLVHDGRVLSETGLLLEYLDETFPDPPLAPSALPERYESGFWVKYAEERIAPYVAQLGWHELVRPGLGRERLDCARRGLAALPIERRRIWEQAIEDDYSPETLTLARDALGCATAALERALERDRWLAGPTYSLADITLVFLARAMRVVTPQMVNRERTPRTLEWLARLEERRAVKETLALARTPAPERMFAPGPEPPRWG